MDALEQMYARDMMLFTKKCRNVFTVITLITCIVTLTVCAIFTEDYKKWGEEKQCQVVSVNSTTLTDFVDFVEYYECGNTCDTLHTCGSLIVQNKSGICCNLWSGCEHGAAEARVDLKRFTQFLLHHETLTQLFNTTLWYPPFPTSLSCWTSHDIVLENPYRVPRVWTFVTFCFALSSFCLLAIFFFRTRHFQRLVNRDPIRNEEGAPVNFYQSV